MTLRQEPHAPEVAVTQEPAGAVALAVARETLRIEAAAVLALADRLEGAFAEALDLVLNARGRVVVTGIGKSGHIGRKIAATLASTGTPAFFVHATEALHGDAGMVHRHDVLLALSNSGSTEEVCHFSELVAGRGVPVIALVGRTVSRLATCATVVVDVGVECEADPIGLAPTASTTAALAMGDAFAAALMACRGFTAAEFAAHHPAGALGQSARDLPPAGP